MKLFSKVIVFIVCLGLVLAAEDDQNKNNTSNATGEDGQPKADAPTEEKELPNGLCSTCNCDAAKKLFDCSSAKLYKLFNMTEWLTLNASGVATDTMLLDRNGIASVPQFPLLDVKILDLSHNNISTIAKKAFIGLSNLEVLDLSYNMLTSNNLIPEIFEGSYNPDEYLPLEKLRVLRLGNNQLHSLDQDLFEHMPNLEELSLVSNVFKVIDRLSETAIASVKTLRSLDLSYMELLSIPEYIFNAPQGLEYLNLTGNLLTTIPEALIYATHLKWLSLDENPIDNIQGDHVFPTLKSLEYLSLSYITPLKMIGRGAFSNLEGLKEVHICNNPEFSFFHADAFVRSDPDEPTRKIWPLVKKLYLHNNNLSTLDAQTLARWDNMDVIDMRVNPWNCDCQNQWLVETLLPQIEKTTPEIMNNVVCATPKQMAGVSMVDLEHKHSQMRCVDKYGNNPQNDGALLIGLLIGLLAGIPLTAALIMIYKRGCFGLVRRGPADFSRAFYSRATNDDY
ncbi:leucine-rich repeat neuronal protein 3-like [Wyeomyia smithii]|uniref:leucine-rich repeat neuronal protein 3-like n=1 Tax=Wyeomyia smithii TaxID=174621 RepID=UPI002467F962|nr:leucine-rich repeat neuronal protein 3-like [Wyeomyia smithii]